MPDTPDLKTPKHTNFSFLGKIFQRQTSEKTKIDTPILSAEFGIDDSAIYKRLKLVPYTPDDLLKRKDFSILQKMMDDPEIAGAINTFKTIRLSSGWEIIASDESDRAKEIREFVEYNFDYISGSFDDDLNEMLDAVAMGWSLSELVWDIIPDGKWAGKINLKALKARNPKYFNVFTDDFDNPLQIINRSSMEYGGEYDISKFVVYTWQKQYENVFGKSRIITLYDYWYLKQVFVRAWGIYTEKYGHPFPVVKVPPNIDDKAKNSILNMIRQIRIETGMVIPNTIEFELKEAQSQGGKDPYTAGLDWFNTQIRKVILGQSLSAEAGKVGSYSLGQVHMDVLMMFEEQLGIDIAEKAINPQIIKRLVDYNYRNVTEYPEFRFKPLIQEDREKIINLYYLGVTNGTIKPIPEDEKFLREWMHLPYKADKLITPETTYNTPTPEPTPTPTPVDNIEEDYSEFSDTLFTGVQRREFTPYEVFVDFAEIRQIQREDTLSSSYKIAKIIQDGVKELIDDIGRKKILQDKNIKAINTLQLKYVGDIKQEFEKVLTDAFKKGMRDGRKETTGRKKALKFRDYRNFSEVKIFASVDLRDVTPVEAMEYFRQKIYRLAGFEKSAIESKIKDILLNAIKTGATLKDTISEIDSNMEVYINLEANDASIAEDVVGGRIETIVRTNYMDALNQGRKAFFEDPALDDYVVAYQYSAILDDRVRPNHAWMDGKTYSVNNPIWKKWMPPNGYNCRCMVVPITSDDTWTESELPPKNITPDKGFNKPGEK